MDDILNCAIEKLAVEFTDLNWNYRKESSSVKGGTVSCWPGNIDEDIIVCVLKSRHFKETFHKQNFFFFNFAYRGDYQAYSAEEKNLITVNEGGCYIGQPNSGYALQGNVSLEKPQIIIVGILIKKEAFFREYLSVISTDATIFNFFLEPQLNPFSESFICLKFETDMPIRDIIEIMIVEYAFGENGIQSILKPLFLTLLKLIERRHRMELPRKENYGLADRIVQYITEHLDYICLNDISEKFSYHPNYISNLLRKEKGKSFSEILLEKRMERAAIMIRKTKLTIEEIAIMVGYKDISNFYKAFQRYYHISPRKYALSGQLLSLADKS
ncbi:MAG: AraC family transcriptional regulator [Hespellia sp.]|nr:AraC family transcriptional regulator [Hespellia sp.]